jgi:hypothetical protein
MHRSAMVTLMGIFCLGSAVAQSDKTAQASASAVNASLAPGSAIRAQLATSVDSKKVKIGDTVAAQTLESIKADGNTLIPRGTKLVGRVTQAAARSKGDSNSSLGLVFEKAIPKHGQEIPLKVAVQAMAPPEAVAGAPSSPEMDSGAMGKPSAPAAPVSRPGSSGGLTPPASVPGSAANPVSNTDTNDPMPGRVTVGGLNAIGQLTSDSKGVFGLPGIGLSAGTAGAEPTTLITSTGKEVRLESGTQLLLVTQAANPTQATQP